MARRKTIALLFLLTSCVTQQTIGSTAYSATYSLDTTTSVKLSPNKDSIVMDLQQVLLNSGSAVRIQTTTGSYLGPGTCQ